MDGEVSIMEQTELDGPLLKLSHAEAVEWLKTYQAENPLPPEPPPPSLWERFLNWLNEGDRVI